MSFRVEKLAAGITIYCGDCREILPTLGYFDAVVSDPPYGILSADSGSTAVRKAKRTNGGKLKTRLLSRSPISWDVKPTAHVISALRAISREQIFWGGNYLDLPPTRCVLVWDKQQPWENFSQVEIAWVSSDRPAALFRRSACAIPDKLHPTQKPIELMRWCLRFVPTAQTILDPYMGSGTTGVAAVEAGRAFTGIELDQTYFDIACRRISKAIEQAEARKSQTDLFLEKPQARKQTSLDL